MDRPIDAYRDREQFFVPRGAILRIEDGRGTLLKVNRGAVWLTQEGDFRDIFREANQSFVLDRDGAALAYACRHTSVTLTGADLRRERIRVVHPNAANDEVRNVAVGG
jgi:hypothetical protein